MERPTGAAFSARFPVVSPVGMLTDGPGKPVPLVDGGCTTSVVRPRSSVT
ncbi:hypothetical protein NHH88_01675 [Oxalobacteraceae bacterium OTU3CAMAD1]|nr:hypothetical protein NHH88_01675 [Oxalobacteraceae bacterium OTU3CAMAD1]